MLVTGLRVMRVETTTSGRGPSFLQTPAADCASAKERTGLSSSNHTKAISAGRTQRWQA